MTTTPLERWPAHLLRGRRRIGRAGYRYYPHLRSTVGLGALLDREAWGAPEFATIRGGAPLLYWYDGATTGHDTLSGSPSTYTGTVATPADSVAGDSIFLVTSWYTAGDSFAPSGWSVVLAPTSGAGNTNEVAVFQRAAPLTAAEAAGGDLTIGFRNDSFHVFGALAFITDALAIEAVATNIVAAPLSASPAAMDLCPVTAPSDASLVASILSLHASSAPAASAAWDSISSGVTAITNDVSSVVGFLAVTIEVATAGASWAGTKTATYHGTDFVGTTSLAVAFAPVAFAPAGGTDTAQAVAGSVSAAGALVRATAATRGGSAAPGAVLARAIAAARSGSSSAAGTAARAVTKSTAGSTTPAGALVRGAGKLLAGLAAPAATLNRSITRTLNRTVTVTAALARLSTVSLAGALTPAGAPRRTISKVLAAGAAVAGALTRLFTGGASQGTADLEVACATATLEATADRLTLTAAADRLRSLEAAADRLSLSAAADRLTLEITP